MPALSFAPLENLRLLPRAAALLLLSGVAVSGQSATADEADELIRLINQFREAPQSCEGRQVNPRAPLSPSETLSGVQLGQQTQLQLALQQAGYQPASAQAFAFAGPTSATIAMGMIKERYCLALLDQDAADIGVRREGDRWQIILAQPLVADGLGDWREAGKAVLERVNEARSEPRHCGATEFAAAPALRWNDQLAAAALEHSRDMAEQDYFSHSDQNGLQVDSRARDLGYQFKRIGENLAAGQGSVEQVVAGWLASPDHCANVMEPAYTEMGAAYVLNPNGENPILWTQVFGTPLR